MMEEACVQIAGSWIHQQSTIVCVFVYASACACHGEMGRVHSGGGADREEN